MGKTIDRKKSVHVMPELQKWKDLLARIKEVKVVGHMFGKLCVFVKEAETDERANEVPSNVRKCLVDYPGKILLEVFSDSLYAGADGIESPRKITMGDSFLSADGRRGTIGLFMNKHGSDSIDLYFVTSSHIVVKYEDVTTVGPIPIPLGIRAHSLPSDFKLLDISVIKIHPNMKSHCNPYFQDKNETRKCRILDMDSIQCIGVGEHVYKQTRYNFGIKHTNKTLT
ncbi:hypothetical protein CHS0354_024314 [Potamilus streckersoni]|uniref:Uncharacterized protein n=1 Tax=Potamilus streckersoni TaxID=2493646 RepID=A0AAE0RNC2_9BIVA|nr:hypothetical protein CHS0354_024314 [Potamilus streckersoni]